MDSLISHCLQPMCVTKRTCQERGSSRRLRFSISWITLLLVYTYDANLWNEVRWSDQRVNIFWVSLCHMQCTSHVGKWGYQKTLILYYVRRSTRLWTRPYNRLFRICAALFRMNSCYYEFPKYTTSLKAPTLPTSDRICSGRKFCLLNSIAIV